LWSGQVVDALPPPLWAASRGSSVASHHERGADHVVTGIVANIIFLPFGLAKYLPVSVRGEKVFRRFPPCDRFSGPG